MSRPTPSAEEIATRGALGIYSAFVALRGGFNAITARARKRFEARDWQGIQDDAVERLEIHPRMLDRTLGDLKVLLGERLTDLGYWRQTRQAYAAMLAEEPNRELAETFFNSTTRRIFATVGVNADIEFFTLGSPAAGEQPDPGTYRRYIAGGELPGLVRRILEDHRFDAPYKDAAGDARLVARALEEALVARGGAVTLQAVEVLRPVFFRNKGAYIVGRLRLRDGMLPFVLPLLHPEGGITVDAVLTDEDLVSIVFSFARSYFHVEADCPRRIIAFLRSILPLKPVAELYISLGLNKHGKTELYRDLQRHLAGSGDLFEIAEGARGMVMLVFTLPSYDVVFKVIRDRFAYPKTTTRQQVMDRYRMVFKRDRVGRLVDAQEFKHLTFQRERFAPDLLAELQEQAASSVRLVGDQVVIEHLYTERRMTPLNLYVREAAAKAAVEAILDYGRAIKELAASNIFPGDFLLKNFGVTRHGRVVFYDYDELTLVTDCVFREMPPPRSPEEELDSETWFPVGEHDIFPEEFRTFLGLAEPLRDLFAAHHGDLFTVDFWRRLQHHNRRGEIMEFFPYPQECRLRPGEGAQAPPKRSR